MSPSLHVIKVLLAYLFTAVAFESATDHLVLCYFLIAQSNGMNLNCIEYVNKSQRAETSDIDESASSTMCLLKDTVVSFLFGLASFFSLSSLQYLKVTICC